MSDPSLQNATEIPPEVPVIAPKAVPVSDVAVPRWKRILENAFVSAFTAAIISGMITVWFESRLENSKHHVANILKQKEQFDSAQSNVFTQLGLFTGKLFDKSNVAGSKEQLQGTIIAAQLQVNRLLLELPKSDHQILAQYANELDALSRSLREVRGPNDLGPVYASAQKLLELHDQVSERVRGNLEVSMFWRNKS